MKSWLIALCTLSFAFAQEELSTLHFKIVFDSPELRPYASLIAAEAEKALDVLEPLLGAPDEPIILNLEDETDSYNAFASLLPRPTIRLRGLFPLDGDLGFGAKSDLYLLLIHELSHISQLAYTGSEPFRIGLPTDGIAAAAPPWFIEGIAVYIESAYTEGGRVNDARTLGLLYSKAVADDLPDLSELSLTTFDEWPYGAARYLYGGHFVSYLVDKYGFEAILRLLRAYNSGLIPISFSAAWQTANETSLESEWADWQVQVKAEALSKQVRPDLRLSETGAVSHPSLSPDGNRLAWVNGSNLMLAELKDGELQEVEVVQRRVRPLGLSWLDEQTLVYNRTYRQPTSSFNELFSFNLETKQETKLSSGARAFFPAVSADHCVYYVKDDVMNGSSLIKRCADVETLMFQTRSREHIVGLALSPSGQIAMSIWRQGFVDLAILQASDLQFLTQDAYQDMNPHWESEDALLFSSDRQGGFDLYRLELRSRELIKLSQSLGGAFEPIQSPEGILYVVQSQDGYDLAHLEEPLLETIDLKFSEPELPQASGDWVEVQAYSPLPSLFPYAWSPSYFDYGLSPISLGLGVSVLGQDYTGKHSYTLNLAYDTALSGPLSGLGLNVRYGFQDNVDAVRLKDYPFGVQFIAGLYPHVPHLQGVSENAFGVQAQLRLIQPLDNWSIYGLGRLGVIYLSSFNDWQLEGLGNVIVSQRFEDEWGYVSSGMRFGLTGVWSATSVGPSPGAWLNATYYSPLTDLGLELSGTLELGLRLGYRQGPPIPLALAPWAASSSLGYRYSYPVAWRYDDGLFALERVTLETRFRSWYDGDLGIGGDVTLNADTVLSYNAPLTLSATVGYSQLFWYRIGLGFSLD